MAKGRTTFRPPHMQYVRKRNRGMPGTAKVVAQTNDPAWHDAAELPRAFRNDDMTRPSSSWYVSKGNAYIPVRLYQDE